MQVIPIHPQSTRLTLIKSIHRDPPKPKIAFASTDGLHLIPWADISHCSARGNYCTIQSIHGHSWMLSRTLKSVIASLPTEPFFRIHQSHYVQLNQISFIALDKVTLENGEVLELARSRRVALMREISKQVRWVGDEGVKR